MTKTLLVLLTASLSLGASAQQGVLTSGEYLPIGSSYTIRNVQTPVAIDTTAGTNVTWNMAGLVLTGAEQTTNFLAPGSTPYGSSFPGANLSIFESSLPRYSYFDRTGTDLSRVGFYYGGDYGHYTDPQVEIRFPLQYGSTSNDTWDCDAWSFPGTYRYTCSGSGTLVLPSGTYQDVLLLRCVSNNLVDYKFYQWISAETGAYLLLYFVPNIPFQTEGAQALTSMVVGMDETNGLLPMRLHGVVQDNLMLTYTSNETVRYRLVDVTGRTVDTGNLPPAQESSANLNVGTLRTGTYLLELSTGATSRTERFLKP